MRSYGRRRANTCAWRGYCTRTAPYDGAVYHCGYAVEIALKTRLCRTLRWAGFPGSAKEFQNFKSLQTHNLETLLRFSGVESRVTLALDAEWSQVKEWNPEQRYDPVGTQTAADSGDMITATRKILRTVL